MGNIRKQVDIKLVTSENGCIYYLLIQPTYNYIIKYSENLAIVQIVEITIFSDKSDYIVIKFRLIKKY